MNDNMEIGRNIANYRKLKRLTQYELAKAVGVSKGYISVIEKGIKQPRIKVLVRIAKVLAVELGSLLSKRC